MRKYPKNLLANGTRRAIYELIKSEPGITQSEIAHSIQVSYTCVVWHLRKLEYHGLIVSKADDQVHCFLNGGLVNPRHKDIILALYPKTAFKIVEILARHGPSFQKDIHLKINVSSCTINNHLKRLIEQGIVQRQHEPEDARSYKYTLIEARMIQLVIDEYSNLRLRKSI